MGLKAMNVFLLIALTCLIQTAIAKPRDSSIVEDPSVVSINEEVVKEGTTTQPENTVLKTWPGRKYCKFEEANEDTVCQEHCLPKGYTYGICVSNTCSCI